jgi:hypothetical protein
MKKGLAIPISEVFNALMLIAFIVFAIYIWKGSYFDINILVQTEENQRRIVTLGQILLSSPRLVAFEDERALRDILDPAKLDALVLDSQNLYQEVNYPNSSYEFTVKDKIDPNKVWPISPGKIVADFEFERQFPLTIKYSDNEINPGIMELKYYVNNTEGSAPSLTKEPSPRL